MPMQPATRCSTCGHASVGPCSCRAQQRRQHDRTRDRQDYRALYKTSRWQRLARRHRMLHPWCVGFPAGCHGATGRLADCTDHIVPAYQRPDLFFDEANLQSLCTQCNTRKSVQLERAHG